MAENRRHDRILTELDVSLWELGEDGALLDDRCRAQDISPLGFRVSAQARLEKGQRVRFELNLDDDFEPAKGEAEVVWTETDTWGGSVMGVRILSMSWRDRRRLRGRTSTPGYDFVGLARRAAISVFWIVLALGAHNIAFHQPVMREVLMKLTVPLAAVMGISLALWIVKGK